MTLDTDVPPPPVEHHFGYGVLGVGFCGRCSEVRTLFAHSAIHTAEMNPLCYSCVSLSINTEIHHQWLAHHEVSMRRTEVGDTPEVLADLAHVEFMIRMWRQVGDEWQENHNSLQHSREEIVKHEWGCVACCKFWHPDDTRPRRKPITALDLEGNPVTVHAECASTCQDCGKTLINNDYRIQGTNAFVAISSFFVEVYNEDVLCRSCTDSISDDYFMCGCGRYCHRDNGVVRFGEEWFCGGCGDNIYNCDHCGWDYWESDGHECHEQDDNQNIHRYDWQPRGGFTFHGKDPHDLYLGFELEVESNGNDICYHAERLRDMLETTMNRGYLKYDGSLDDGFEIVSQPHTLSELHENFPWGLIVDLQQAGFRSWDTDTCGIHVHVSKRAFGWDATRRIQEGRVEAHALRFLKLIYDNDRHVRRLAGRSSDQWASFDDKRKLIPKVKRGYQSNARYSAVNVSNAYTFEVRVFRGSMRVERIKANLEFVHACVEYTRNLSVSPNNNTLQWSRFRKWIVDKPEYANLNNLLNNLPRTVSAESEEN